jgi:hypothetical protein
MKNQIKRNFSHTMQRKIVFEMINAGYDLAEKLGRHPLTKGCNCIDCIHKRKRILQPSEKNWKFRL